MYIYLIYICIYICICIVCCKYVVCILCNNTENVTPPLNDVLYKRLNALIHISPKKRKFFR